MWKLFANIVLAMGSYFADYPYITCAVLCWRICLA